MPTLNCLLETALYVDDLERATRFYQDVFDFQPLDGGDTRPQASSSDTRFRALEILGQHSPRGGTSLYFRDPNGHMLELATPGLWSIY